MPNINFTAYVSPEFKQQFKLPEFKMPIIKQKDDSSKEEEITIAPLPEPEEIVVPIRRGTTIYKDNINVGNMQSVIDKFNDAGISIRVTSGLRPGAKTASGNTSHHASGDAIDITPGEGETWDTLRAKIRNSPELTNWMQQHGYGILDETNPSVMAQTKATGAHWHIGKDSSAVAGLKALLVQKGGRIEGMPPGYKRQYNLDENIFNKI